MRGVFPAISDKDLC